MRSGEQGHTRRRIQARIQPHARCGGDSRAPGLMRASWRMQARCRGMAADIFYPPERETRAERNEREGCAKQVCRTCPVLAACFDYAVQSAEPHGIWGGATPSERERAMLVEAAVRDEQ